MRVVAGVKGHLQALPAIAGLVSTRVYELILPEKPTLPAVVLTRISDPRLGAQLRGPGGRSVARVQIDSYAKTPDDASALGTLARRRMDGFTGLWTSGGSPADTIEVSGIQHDDEREFFEEDILGGLCRHSADYLVTYEASDETILAFV